MHFDTLTLRRANAGDLERLRSLMDVAISLLQTAFLSPEQIAASRYVMGLDTQLITDGTYF
ncbi:MAG TPA: GNAT family N-acetyltransferase, partial [Caulobacteraceae bacterium]|nr:GNAT family N-acetyltransferase [Caulobacteraceae bacterium]